MRKDFLEERIPESSLKGWLEIRQVGKCCSPGETHLPKSRKQEHMGYCRWNQSISESESDGMARSQAGGVRWDGGREGIHMEGESVCKGSLCGDTEKELTL